MIKEEKIRMMTQVAMIQKREERRANGLFAAYTYRRYLYGQWYTGSFFFKAGAD